MSEVLVPVSPGVSFSESQCEVRTTPLRAFNANMGVLYILLTGVAVIIVWFSSTKTGAASFDTNIYRLTNKYSGNQVVPPAGTSSLVALTPMGTALALLGALALAAMFHFVYALDCRRLYTLLLVDRCNGMRWAQYAIVHTVLAMIVAQMLGTTTFDFMMFALLALPCLGVLGYLGDRAYPCSPHMVYATILGSAVLLLAYWIPVITNFAYRNADSPYWAPAYMWVALAAFFIYDVFLFVSPWIQSRHRPSYFFVETFHSMGLLLISTVVVIAVGWALADQAVT